MPRLIHNEVIHALDALSEAHQQAIFDAYADGGRLAGLVQELAQHTGVPIKSRGFFAWARHTPERRQQWLEAQQTRAEVLSEETLAIADDTPPLSESIAKATMQIKTRQALAAKLDPERFGAKPESPVTIGQLFLSAIQQINAEDTQRNLAQMQQERTLAAPREDGDAPEAEPAPPQGLTLADVL